MDYFHIFKLLVLISSLSRQYMKPEYYGNISLHD
jgi:hypothetical protein